MHRNARRFLVLTAFAFTLALLPLTSRAQGPAEIKAIHDVARRLKQAEIRAQDPVNAAIDRSDVTSLLNQFRNADDDTMRRRVATGLFKVGGPGAGRLVRLIETEYQRGLRAYRRAFQKQVAKVVLAQRKDVTAEQIEALQEQVRELRRDPGLTKDRIAKEGDPAMARLAEWLTVDREVVLRSSKELLAQRDDLLTMASIGQQAVSHLPADEKALAVQAPDPAAVRDDLAASEQLLAFLATPMTDEALDVMLDNARIAQALDAQEAESIRILNVMRIRVGMQPLAIDLKLGDASRDHSKDMATHPPEGFFSHTSPIEGKRTPWDRARNFGTTASGENIAHGYASPQAVINGWWYSPGHHKNMMNPGFRRIGVGRHNSHWTQMFGS